VASRKFLVLDANIIIRSVLGIKVSSLIIEMSNDIIFITPDVCINDAYKYLPELFKKRGMDLEEGTKILNSMLDHINVFPPSLYGKYEKEAKERIEKRDINDWPIVASALVLDAPIWTEDTDFFGTGIAIWTTDRVKLYLRAI
jgi:predicted nucleic acid-binding protein